MKRVRLLQLVLVLNVSCAGEKQYDDRVHQCFREVELHFIRNELFEARKCLLEMLEIRKRAVGGFDRLEDGAVDAIFSISAARLMYLDILEGNEEEALVSLRLAVQIEEDAQRLLMPNMNFKEKSLLVLEKWLRWESRVNENLNKSGVYEFYHNLKIDDL